MNKIYFVKETLPEAKVFFKFYPFQLIELLHEGYPYSSLLSLKYYLTGDSGSLNTDICCKTMVSTETANNITYTTYNCTNYDSEKLNNNQCLYIISDSLDMFNPEIFNKWLLNHGDPSFVISKDSDYLRYNDLQFLKTDPDNRVIDINANMQISTNSFEQAEEIDLDYGIQDLTTEKINFGNKSASKIITISNLANWEENITKVYPPVSFIDENENIGDDASKTYYIGLCPKYLSIVFNFIIKINTTLSENMTNKVEINVDSDATSSIHISKKSDKNNNSLGTNYIYKIPITCSITTTTGNYLYEHLCLSSDTKEYNKSPWNTDFILTK